MTTKRLVFCTNDSLFSSLILEQLLACEQIDIAGIYFSSRVRTKSGSLLGDIARIIKTSGLNYACYLALGTLFFEHWPLKHGRPTAKKLAQKNDIPCFTHKDINAPASINWLNSLNVDVLFSGFFNQKLGKQALQVPSIDCVNLHPAPLPRYKGVDPVFYCFLNQEKTLTISLHRMDQHYDTGNVLDTASIRIEPNRSIFWHNVELFKLGAELLINWATQSSKRLTESKLAPAESSACEREFYDSWPTPKQAKRLKGKLFSLKDFCDQATSEKGESASQ